MNQYEMVGLFHDEVTEAVRLNSEGSSGVPEQDCRREMFYFHLGKATMLYDIVKPIHLSPAKRRTYENDIQKLFILLKVL